MDWLESVTENVPVFIVENIVELVGTLLASILIAVVTTYIFNRIQERQKVKARVMHFRMEMYEEIIKFLKRYDQQISYENDSDDLTDALTLAGFDKKEYKLHTSRVLTEWNQMVEFQNELDQLCTRGIYILDDGVLRKLLSLKIYMFNCILLADVVEGYQLKNGKQLSEEEIMGIRELFYQYYSLVSAENYSKFVAELEIEIHKKRTNLKFERAGKNYKVIWRRNLLKKKVWKKAGYKEQYPKAFVLMGLCICSHLGYDQEQTLEEMEGWTQHMQRFLNSVCE